MLEQTMAQRNRSIGAKPGKGRAALTLTHPNASGNRPTRCMPS
jgi:hypothetical protein